MQTVAEMIDAVVSGKSAKEVIEEGATWSAAKRVVHHLVKKHENFMGKPGRGFSYKGGKRHCQYRAGRDDKDPESHKDSQKRYHEALTAHGFVHHKKTKYPEGTVRHYKHKDGSTAQLRSEAESSPNHRAHHITHLMTTDPGRAMKKTTKRRG